MKKDKMTTLQQDGLRLVAEGRTSLEELQRVFKPA
jgi:type IV pilus assembly protein PilB